MAKRFTLDFEDDYDYVLIGIFCSYRDYRLCFELNGTLDLNLARQPDLELKLEKKGASSLFPVFWFRSDDTEDFFVVGNKGSTALFIPELKQVDYFLLVRNASRYTSAEQLTKKLREIEIISSAVELKPADIKSADHFLLIEAPTKKKQDEEQQL